MVRVSFDKISLSASKSCKCIGCGKRLSRQKTEYETVNPFNVNSDGTMKARDEVRRSVQQKLAKWREAPETCSGCEGSRA